MFWIGTSGYNYLEWRGNFYPPTLPPAKMLPYYAAHFSTVEINYTFYRLPTESMVRGWAAATPDPFRLTLKAPRRITHDAKLQNCRPLVESFTATARVLGDKLGVLLFQLAPTFKVSFSVLDEFLSWLPSGVRVAFEFRHASWHTPEVFARLRAHNAALCIAESERSPHRLSTATQGAPGRVEGHGSAGAPNTATALESRSVGAPGQAEPPLVATADFGYYRLRDEGYSEADLERWAGHLREQHRSCDDLFVYFKHEEAGKGPEFAKELMRLLDL